MDLKVKPNGFENETQWVLGRVEVGLGGKEGERRTRIGLMWNVISLRGAMRKARFVHKDSVVWRSLRVTLGAGRELRVVRSKGDAFKRGVNSLDWGNKKDGRGGVRLFCAQ